MAISIAYKDTHPTPVSHLYARCTFPGLRLVDGGSINLFCNAAFKPITTIDCDRESTLDMILNKDIIMGRMVFFILALKPNRYDILL